MRFFDQNRKRIITFSSIEIIAKSFLLERKIHKTGKTYNFKNVLFLENLKFFLAKFLNEQ